jgi:hypothetical protein
LHSSHACLDSYLLFSLRTASTTRFIFSTRGENADRGKSRETECVGPDQYEQHRASMFDSSSVCFGAGVTLSEVKRE